jgi:hypothetical protein
MFESETQHHVKALQLAGVIEEQTRVLDISFPEYHLDDVNERIKASTGAVGEGMAVTLKGQGRKMSLSEVFHLLNAQESTRDVVLQTL